MGKFVVGLVLGVALGVFGVSGVVKTTLGLGQQVVSVGASAAKGVAK